MKKSIFGLFLLLGVTFSVMSVSTTAEARSPIRVRVPQCYYVMVPVTQYVLVWTGFGYAYQAVTAYSYQLVCY